MGSMLPYIPYMDPMGNIWDVILPIDELRTISYFSEAYRYTTNQKIHVKWKKQKKHFFIKFSEFSSHVTPVGPWSKRLNTSRGFVVWSTHKKPTVLDPPKTGGDRLRNDGRCEKFEGFLGETVGGWVQDGAPKCDGYVGLQTPEKYSLVISTGNHS